MNQFAMVVITAVFGLGSGSVLAADCGPPDYAPDPAVQRAVDAIVAQALSNGFAGGVAIAKDGKMVYDRVAGFADRESQVPVGPGTLFHVASMTKYFTAILTLKAVEEGAVELDQPLARYLKDTNLAARDYLFSDLLAHRTGLGSTYAAENINDPETALLAIDATSVDESSIGSFHYSNDGYDLLGILLERVYRRPYEDLVTEKLLDPACIDHAGFWGRTDLGDPTVVSQPLRDLPASLLGRNYGMLASAGLLITAADLVRFQVAMRNGQILAAPLVTELFTPRGDVSIGNATFGAFLVERPGLGQAVSVRGYEDWGDNGYLNEYLACGVTLAVVTSRGPAENSGKPAFRASISEAIETQVLPGLCAIKPE